MGHNICSSYIHSELIVAKHNNFYITNLNDASVDIFRDTDLRKKKKKLIVIILIIINKKNLINIGHGTYQMNWDNSYSANYNTTCNIACNTIYSTSFGKIN